MRQIVEQIKLENHKGVEMCKKFARQRELQARINEPRSTELPVNEAEHTNAPKPTNEPKPTALPVNETQPSELSTNEPASAELLKDEPDPIALPDGTVFVCADDDKISRMLLKKTIRLEGLNADPKRSTILGQTLKEAEGLVQTVMGIVAQVGDRKVICIFHQFMEYETETETVHGIRNC